MAMVPGGKSKTVPEETVICHEFAKKHLSADNPEAIRTVIGHAPKGRLSQLFNRNYVDFLER
jgi:hypothetical protein